MKELFRKIIEEKLREFHLKEIDGMKLYLLKNKGKYPALYGRIGGKLHYVCSDPDQVGEKVKNIIDNYLKNK